MKKINGKRLCEAAEALKLERAMVESVAEMLATTPYQTTMQDNEGKDEVEDEVPELMKVEAIAPSSSKHKGQGDGSAVYAEVSGPVSNIQIISR
jgi:hypothetical protein